MKTAVSPVSVSDTTSGLESIPVVGIFAEITAGLANGKKLETLLEGFLVPIIRLAGAKAGAVRTLTDDDQHMRLVGNVGLPEGVIQTERSVDRHCGICGTAADTDTVVWANDLKPCARHSNEAGYFGLHCKRVLAVPLRHRERVLGIYNLFFDSDAELSPEISAVLRSIGELLGLALYNTRLERENLRVTVMNERKLLASEVHDSIAQTLVYVSMRLPLLQDAMLKHDDQLSLKYFSDVKQGVCEVHSSLREILTNFRVSMNPQGLMHALQEIADGFQSRTGVALEFNRTSSEPALSVEQEVQVFHIVQEALANITKHSHAQRASLAIGQTPECFEVTIEDDGGGMALPGCASQFNPALLKESHFGIEIMKERAQLLGGRIEVSPRAGGGTRVRLVIPMAAKGRQETRS